VERSAVGYKTKGNDPLIVWYGLPLLKREEKLLAQLIT
jgi:hypothetical protein